MKTQTSLLVFALLVASTSNKKVNLAQVKSKSHTKLHSKAHAKTKTHIKAHIKAESKLKAFSKAKAGSCENGEGVDTFGDGCDWYDANPTGCGNYDSESWTSAAACCACGGGSDDGSAAPIGANITAPITTFVGGDDCYDDMTVADSFGDDCTWYDANVSGCGSYDSDTFVAADACIACGACDEGFAASANATAPADDCTNGGGVDSYGDSCDWYDGNPDGCGNYDTSTWTSAAACCACGGSAEIYDATAPIVDAVNDDCTNGGGVDSFGDSCDWYDGNPSGCGSYDTDSWTSAAACCACGGSAETY